MIFSFVKFVATKKARQQILAVINDDIRTSTSPFLLLLDPGSDLEKNKDSEIQNRG